MSKDKGKSHLEKSEDNVPECDLERSKNDICRIWQDNQGKEQELEQLFPSFRAVGNQNPEEIWMKGNSTLASLGMLKCIVLPVHIIERFLPLAKAGNGKKHILQ